MEPRVLLLPPGAASSSGPDCAELAEKAGLDLDPWQRFVLDGAMSEHADGSWAADEVGLIAARQNGKNGIIEALEAYHLTVLGSRVIHTAHQFKTTLESWDRLLALIEDSVLADYLVGKHATPAQGYVMRFKGGGRINFIARSKQSGRGLTGDLLICDESQDLANKTQGALLPTISARPGAQSWYLGSAPFLDSEVFQRLRKRGRAGEEKRLAYFEYSADPDSDPSDREAWAQANPAFGIRISERVIEAEFRTMDPDEFARERLSISPDVTEGSGVLPLEKWQACGDERSGPVGPVAFSLDVSPDRLWASFAVAAASGVGGTHIELVDRLPGTDWLVGRAKELQDKWGGALAVAAGSPAASLLTELEAAGVTVVEVSTADHAEACGALFDAVMQGTVKHIKQPELEAAVMAADRRYYGDAWLWSRRNSSSDISSLVAVTLAKWLHDQPERAAEPFVMVG